MNARFLPLIALALELASACGGGDLALPSDSGPAENMTLASGDKQTGAVGGPLGRPLVVKVTDGAGRPVAGVAVRWSAGSGSVDPESTVTDDNGQASTQRVLGDNLGAQSATATSEGLGGSPVEFHHTAVAGNATRLVKVAGDGQTAAAGSTLRTTLVVRLLDAADNPIAGHAVTWLITGGDGDISPASGTTDASGRSSARWTLGSGAGKQTASAIVTGVGVVEFTATATVVGGGGGGDGGKGGKGGGKGGKGGGGSDAIVPARVSMLRGNNQRARAGTAVSTAPAIFVADSAGNAVAGVPVVFTVVDGGGNVIGPEPVTDASGIAAVGRWVLGKGGGTNRLRATAQSAGIVGNPVTFMAVAVVTPPLPPPLPERLVFRVQPSRTKHGGKIEPAVQVAVMRGSAVSSLHVGTVTLELVGGDPRARLRGSAQRDLSGGVATFNSLRIDREGRYRLRASINGLPMTESDPFDILDD